MLSDLHIVCVCLQIAVAELSRVGVRSQSPGDVPSWHEDYFELKTIKAQQTQGEVFLCVLFLLPPHLFLPKEIQIEEPASGREP